MMKVITSLVAVLAFTLVHAQDAPNIILILADDQGWNGTSVPMDPNNMASKSDFYETPNLERLAGAGMRFSQAYAPSPKCSPSRMSIITGQTTARNKFTTTSAAVTTDRTLITPASNTSISDANNTIPEYLKSLEKDYLSAHFGKWHLGNDDPTLHGFDESDGANSNNQGSGGSSISDDPKKIFSVTQSGIDFMDNAIAASKPFYLQLSHYAVHTDIESTQASNDKYVAKNPGSIHDSPTYAAMTEDLDRAVGLILDYVEEKQIEGKTYIIYTSDNGGQLNATSNAPLKLGKTMLFEGGIRVPMIVSGPGITANSHSSEAVIGYDFYPTFADLAGGDLTTLAADLDGVSIKELLAGNTNTFTRNQPLFFHSPHYESNASKEPRSAAISGSTKIMVEYETGERLLHNLSTDISEENNSYNETTESTKDFLLALRDHLKIVDAQMPTFSTTEEDTDNDGIPDAWEFVNLLGTQYSDRDDPDNDAYTNLEEYQNNTDPLVADEAFPLATYLDVSLILYPNPTNDFVTIAGAQESFVFNLFSLDGKSVYSQLAKDGSHKIDLSTLQRGLYLYQVSFTSNRASVRGQLIIN